MSVFVTTENQELLWRMLQQHSQFYNMDLPQKTLLFRNTIETNYFDVEHTQLNFKQLQDLNKKTIIDILEYKKTAILSPPPSLPPSYIVTETSEDKSVREFKEREKVYRNMTAKPNLPDTQNLFADPVVQDDVITNIEERLIEFQSQRSLDTLPKKLSLTMEEMLVQMDLLEKRIKILEEKLTGESI